MSLLLCSEEVALLLCVKGEFVAFWGDEATVVPTVEHMSGGLLEGGVGNILASSTLSGCFTDGG